MDPDQQITGRQIRNVFRFYLPGEGVRRGFIKPKSEEWERDTVSRVLKIIILSGLVFGVI